MPQLSMFRLYVLRATYVFMFVGLALVKWPGILNPPPGLSNAGSVVGSVLGAISLLALLCPYPLKRLPEPSFHLPGHGELASATLPEPPRP
jgi:hypothetical protein